MVRIHPGGFQLASIQGLDGSGQGVGEVKFIRSGSATMVVLSLTILESLS